MHQPPRLLSKSRQLACQTLALGLVLHDEPAIPGPPAVVGEAKEGECLRVPFASPFASQGRMPAKLDQAGFALVKRQAEAGQTFLEGGHHRPRVVLLLEAHHEVVPDYSPGLAGIAYPIETV